MPDGAGACVVEERAIPGTPGIRLPGVLSLRADSGRLDGRWAGDLRALFGESVADFQLEQVVSPPVGGVQAMVDAAGWSGLDMAAYPSAAVAIEVRLPTNGAGGPEGILAVSGASDGRYCGNMGEHDGERWLEPHPAFVTSPPGADGGCRTVALVTLGP